MKNESQENEANVKPKLDLNLEEITYINVTSERDCREFKRVLSAYGRDYGGDDGDYFFPHTADTCFTVERDWGSLGIVSKKRISELGRKTISLGEFYKSQGITPEKIEEINKWFDENPTK